MDFSYNSAFRQAVIIVVVIAFSLCGCASSGIRTTTGERVASANALEVFESGDARLDCGVSCAGAWGSTRRQAKELYDQELWNDLAIAVMKVGFKADQTYFYLGRAAEGRGLTETARTYYKLSSASDYRCDGIINNCDGLVIPDETQAAIKRLPSPTKAEAPVVASEKSPLKQTNENRKSSWFSSQSNLKDSSNAKYEKSKLLNASSDSKDQSNSPIDQIDVAGLIPDVSTKQDVRNIKTWSGECKIGGMILHCVDNYIDGKLSAIWFFTGKDWSSDEKSSEKISNVEAFKILYNGFTKKFGEPQEYRKEKVSNRFGKELINHFAMWKDNKGNRISIMLYDNSTEKGNAILLSGKYVETKTNTHMQNESERQGKF